MRYTEIADNIYEREDLISLIPEGRKTTPLLPGILDGTAADCLITYAKNEKGEIELYHIARVSGEKAEIIDCRNEKAAISSGQSEKNPQRFAELYPIVREMIAKREITEKDKRIVMEFLRLFEAQCEISMESVQKWFEEYIRLLN